MHKGLRPFINQIHHMDYLDLLTSLPDNSVDLVLTDPPYGMAYVNNNTKNKHKMLAGDGDEFPYDKLAQEAFRILKDDTAIYAFTHWSRFPSHYFDLQSAGFVMKEALMGQKRSPSAIGDLEGSFANNADWCLFAHKGRFKFRETQLVKNRGAGDARERGTVTVAEYKTRFPTCWFGPEYPFSSEPPAIQARYRHPTVKDVRFIEWMIRISTDEGAVIVDPFSGSGTTAAACQRSGRHFIASEYSKKFVEMGRARLGEIVNARPPAK